MGILTEKLGRGLWNRVSPLLMPEGALAFAYNARYRRGDPTVWQAEGRVVVPDVVAPSPGGAGQHVGMEWDTGVTVGIQTSEHSEAQIVGPSPTPGYMTSRGAAEDPFDPMLADSMATQIHLPTNLMSITYPFPEKILGPGLRDAEVVHFEGTHIYLSGGTQNLMFTRPVDPHFYGGQTPPIRSGFYDGAVNLVPLDHVYIIPHGMPVQRIRPTFTTSTVGATPSWVTGNYYYWFVWYADADPTNIIEGAATRDSVGSFVILASNIKTVTMRMDALDFKAAIPAFANKIRVYRSPTIGHDSILTPIAPDILNPYPVGYLAYELQVQTVVGTQAVDPTFPSGFSVTVFANASPVADGTVTAGIPTETVSFTGTDATMRNGPPPSATTGAVKDESLVLNDIENPSSIMYSVPGLPHYFPELYRMWFATEVFDKVVSVKSMEDSLAVVLTRSVWKVNWLPQDGDNLEEAGRARTLIMSGKGAVNSKAVTLFDSPAGLMLAFLDRTGVYATDLDTWIPLTEHIDWGQVEAGGDVRQGSLVDNPDESRLELWVGDLAWYIHYDKMHWQDGYPAITGPINRSYTAWAKRIFTLSGKSQTITGTTDSKLLYNGFGVVDEGSPGSTLSPPFHVRTRLLYPYGVGREARSIHLLGNIRAPATGWIPIDKDQWVIGLIAVRQNEPERINISKILENPESRLLQWPIADNFEACYLFFTAQTQIGGIPVGVDVLGVNVEGMDDG